MHTPGSKEEWDTYLKVNQESLKIAARRVASLYRAGDMDGLVEHANRDAQAYAQDAIRKRDAAIKKARRSKG